MQYDWRFTLDDQNGIYLILDGLDTALRFQSWRTKKPRCWKQVYILHVWLNQDQLARKIDDQDWNW